MLGPNEAANDEGYDDAQKQPEGKTQCWSHVMLLQDGRFKDACIRGNAPPVYGRSMSPRGG
jgi:hypothetical protein